jgi:hypothetical protein
MLDGTVCDRPVCICGLRMVIVSYRCLYPHVCAVVFVIPVSASFYFLNFSPYMFSLSVAIVAQTACLCKYVYHKGLIPLGTTCL